MDATGGTVTSAAAASPPGSLRRSDAGTVRLGERDIAALLLAGEMYGIPYDLLAGSWQYNLTGRAASWPAGATPDTRSPADSALGRRGAG